MSGSTKKENTSSTSGSPLYDGTAKLSTGGYLKDSDLSLYNSTFTTFTPSTSSTPSPSSTVRSGEISEEERKKLEDELLIRLSTYK
jgi:hypothetical protein